MGDILGPLFLVLDKDIIQILELRILLEHSHEILVALLGFNLFAIF